MNKKLEKAFDRFFSRFHYWPKSPQNIDFDQEQYANLLLKCVADDFDYTIEKYGTVVPKKMPRLEIIYD